MILLQVWFFQRHGIEINISITKSTDQPEESAIGPSQNEGSLDVLYSKVSGSGISSPHW